jgi:hypothetical protein
MVRFPQAKDAKSKEEANMPGLIGSASSGLKEAAADARASRLLRSVKVSEAIEARKDDANRLLCEVCGTRPRERKRRGDGTWYEYGACRRCRRLTALAKPASVSITDTRLLRLLQELYERLWALRERGFPGAPRKIVVQRLRALLRVFQE